ncbi:DUF5316 family protein [Metabacillus sp. RGM 3146]|uniref:DUF5316 family protein n=1 Tax=Metabacillus sp. RGM 3146 TaxID=3401092 RepID=UPI003B9BF080
MKSLLAGLGLALIAILVSYLTGLGNLQSYLMTAAIIPIILAIIISGAAVSGDRFRANAYSETKTDRDQRYRWSSPLLLAGLPSLAAAVVMYRIH